MVARPLPDRTAEVLGAFEDARAEYLVARAQWEQTPGGCLDDPASVLAHDAASDRLRAAEGRLRVVIRDARALGVQVEIPRPEPLPWWDWVLGCAGVAATIGLVAWLWVARGWAEVAVVALMLALAAVAVWVASATEGDGPSV